MGNVPSVPEFPEFPPEFPPSFPSFPSFLAALILQGFVVAFAGVSGERVKIRNLACPVSPGFLILYLCGLWPLSPGGRPDIRFPGP